MGSFSSKDDDIQKNDIDEIAMANQIFSLSDQVASNPHWNSSAQNSVPKNLIQNSQKNESPDEINRIHEPLPFFIIHVMIASVISFQNVFIVYGVGQNYQIGMQIIIADLFFIVVFSFLNSFYLVSFKELILLYTLLDGVLVAQIAALVGLVGTFLLTYSQTTTDYLMIIMIPISFFFFVGNFRVCIRYADWNSAQIIIYKLAIMVGAVCFFEIGAHFMAVDYSYTQGQLEELDSKIKDFITLYAFGTFQFFRQLFAKICDFDQTADLKYAYKFKKESNNPNKQIQILDVNSF